MSRILRSITKDGSAVCFATDSREIVEEARTIHHTTPTISAALGRTLTAASLMGITLKGEKDSVTLRIQGNGPAGTILAVSDSHGNVRGCVNNPLVDLPLNARGHLDVSGAVGREGNLYVVKDLGLREPYSGSVPLVSGEIAEDVTQYFARSEQIPTACALGVLVDTDLHIRAAGGLLMQLLPMADEAVVSQLERNVAALPDVTAMLDSGLSLQDMTARVFAGMEFEVLDEIPTAYRCHCSREFVERTLLSLGETELRRLAEEQEVTEITCHFCEKSYHFTAKELESLLQSALEDKENC